MEVKARDRRTVIDALPDDWNTVQVKDVITAFFCGPSPTCEERNIQDGKEWGVLKTTAATKENGWDWTKHKTLPRAFWNRAHLELRKGDVIVTKAGPRHRVGVASWVDFVPPRIIVSGKMIGLRPDPDKVVSLVLAAAISARDAQVYLDQRTTGMAESQVNFENTVLLDALIRIPRIEEQRAIAAVLRDLDALLDGLDRLIAKKRDLKQAAMQQLLTGQARLPGFHGEWGVTQLGDIAHIKTGSRNNEDKVPDGEYPFFVRSEHVERINTYSHDCEAILVPGEGRIGSIFHYIQGRFDVHQRVYAITQFRPEVSGRFVHLCMSFNFGTWAMQNTVKATVDSLRLPTFKNFEVSLPPTFGEQTAIATVLSDMDAELAALEARRDKTRALKRAMMQELLTGKTRLVKPEAAHA
jgi:type I restriction enzyme S subunit